jgi:hypothetical protein
MTIQPSAGGIADRPSPTGLADVIDTILDKGLVIDAFVRVSLVGIELLTIDARIVVASVDTYLRFAEAVSRLDLSETGGEGLPDLREMVTGGQISDMTTGVTHGILEAAGEKLQDFVTESGDKSREITGGRQRKER